MTRANWAANIDPSLTLPASRGRARFGSGNTNSNTNRHAPRTETNMSLRASSHRSSRNGSAGVAGAAGKSWVRAYAHPWPSVSGFFLLLVLVSFATLVRAAEPVGMVLDVFGPVQLVKPAVQNVSMFMALEPGAEIGLGRGAKLVATLYAKGSELSFSGPARLHIKPGSIDLVYGAKPQERVLQAQQVTASSQGIARRQQQAAISMRNIDPLVAPTHQSAVREAAPEFQYAANLEGLFLAVFDQDGRELLREQLKGGGRQRLSGSPALKRGQTYSWTILEDDGTPKTSNRKTFRVLLEDEVQFADASRPGPSASVSQWALYAGLLENLWLRTEAKVIWVRLAKERPGDPTLARFAH